MAQIAFSIDGAQYELSTPLAAALVEYARRRKLTLDRAVLQCLLSAVRHNDVALWQELIAAGVVGPVELPTLQAQ